MDTKERIIVNNINYHIEAINKAIKYKTVDKSYYKIQLYTKNKKAYNKPIPNVLIDILKEYIIYKRKKGLIALFF